MQTIIDHVAFKIDNWNTDRVKAELERRGLAPRPDTGGGNNGYASFHVKDPDGWDLQISGDPKPGGPLHKKTRLGVIAKMRQRLSLVLEDNMKKLSVLGSLVMIIAFAAFAASQQAQYPTYEPKKMPVQIELLTHTEIYDAIHNKGYTTVLVYNGGTEQRGPHDVLGGHSFIAYGKAERLAQKLGNALVAPVMPFSTNEASDKMPGTIGLTGPIFKAVNERVVDQMVKNGFKDIVLMGDHGGGQKELKELATEADKKYSAQGVHVYFCGDVYEKSHKDFDKYLTEHKLPVSSHAGIPDTSELLVLQPKPGAWVRPIYKNVVGDPVLPRGERRDPNAKGMNNGITGDPRPSSVELGKVDLEITINNGYDQITKMIAAKRKTSDD